MRDGIYKVYLQGGGINGFMIGALYQGRLTGCDQTHHVTGQVRDDDGRIRGTLAMRRHARPDGFVEIANLDEIDVTFAGICGVSCGEFAAKIAGHPELKVTANFQWVCGF